MLWMNAPNAKGYALLRVGGRRGAVLYAHRFSYELAYGPVPKGLVIGHLCRMRHCVAPDHLEAVTVGENIRRGETGSNMRSKTHCPQGHPYDEANTYVRPRGGRQCRTCRAAQKKERARRDADALA